MELYLKRYFWILPLIIVMVCAALSASAVNHWVEGKYLLGESGSKSRAKPKKQVIPAKQTVSKDGQAIVTRNIFCSTCDPPPPPTTSTEPVADGDTVPSTSLPLALVATSVGSLQTLSSATVLNTQTSKGGAYWYGEEIPDAGTIERIEPRYVHFRNRASQRLERIDLLGTAPAAVARAEEPKAAPKPTRGGDPDFMAAVDSGIKKIDDTHYDIDRGLVEKVMADPNLVARSARIVPSIKDGKANGFKVYAIRPNSAFAKLGLQNGDTLHAVNGYDMTSPDKALEVYTKVKSANNLSISVTRRGQPVTMEYSIK